MKISKYNTYDEMSKAAAGLVAKQLAAKPASVICFPSGDSPSGMLKEIVAAVNERRMDISQCFFVGLDEWVGMDQNDYGSCKHYLHTNFFSKVNVSAENVMLFDAKSADLEIECEKMNQFISGKGGLDIMIVGIGMNGHLGLNEPGTAFDLYAHLSELDPITVEVGQKYFQQETKLTHGITLGLRHLAEAKIPVLIASGAKKADIIHESLQGLVTTEVPASVLQSIPHAIILLDKEAASELEHGS